MTTENHDQNPYRWLNNVLHLIILLGFALSVYQRNWLNAFLALCILFLTLLPAILRKRLIVFIPPEFEIMAIIFLFCAGYLGSIRGFYEKIWWWDKVMHATSGLLLGVVGFLLVYILNKQKKVQVFMKPAFIAFFSFTFAVTIGTLWEIYEFIGDRLFNMKMQSHSIYSNLEDTMWDLILDSIGALIISLLGYSFMKSGKESFIHLWITKFINANPRVFKKRITDKLE